MADLSMHRGDDKSYEITVLNRATLAVEDISGCVILMTWKTHRGAEANFLQKTASLTDPTNGVAQFDIAAADTNSLKAAQIFYFDIQITKTDAKIETLYEGTIEIKVDITRPAP